MKYIIIPLLMAAALQSSAQKRMTPELLWSLKRVSADGLSKDGNSVYYKVSEYDIETEKSSTKHYTLNIAGGEAAERNSEKKIIRRDDRVWYATDENTLYTSNDEGKNWRTYYKGIDGADNIQVSPDGKYIAYAKEVMVKPVMGTDIHPDLPKNTAHIYTDLNYRHWDTWEDGKYSHVFIVSVATNETTDIMENEPYDAPQKPFGGQEDFIWTPDSKGVVYVSKKKYGKEYAISTNTDLYYYDIARNQTINLTSDKRGYDMSPAFSKDGKYLAWTSMAREGFEADKNDIFMMDWAQRPAGTKLNLTTGWDGTVGSFIWSNDNRSIYFTAATKGTKQVFRVAVPANVNVRMIPVVDQLTEGKFDVTGIVGQSGDKLVVSRTDMNHATELYTVDLSKGNMEQLTHENDKTYAGIELSKTELRYVTTADGQQMGVWVIYPPGFDAKKKYPTLLYCQGGPQSALSQFYSFRWNFQLMAANDYIIVAPNRRGMPGWGTKWNEAISKDWGGLPMQDYLAAIDEIAKEPYVDKDRLGCVGASYGGYSVFMLAGMHNNRFKSFIAHDGLFDLKSWYGTTEELWFANWDIGGSYWDKPTPESYKKFDPSNFVDKWNTPIMIIQGGLDFRVGIEQGLEAFQAAQLRGIKSKLLYYPNENHWVLHPQNGIVWHREFYKWLEETLK